MLQKISIIILVAIGVLIVGTSVSKLIKHETNETKNMTSGESNLVSATDSGVPSIITVEPKASPALYSTLSPTPTATIPLAIPTANGTKSRERENDD